MARWPRRRSEFPRFRMSAASATRSCARPAQADRHRLYRPAFRRARDRVLSESRGPAAVRRAADRRERTRRAWSRVRASTSTDSQPAPLRLTAAGLPARSAGCCATRACASLSRRRAARRTEFPDCAIPAAWADRRRQSQRNQRLPSFDSWVDEGRVEYLGATDDVRPFIAGGDRDRPPFLPRRPATIAARGSGDGPAVDRRRRPRLPRGRRGWRERLSLRRSRSRSRLPRRCGSMAALPARETGGNGPVARRRRVQERFSEERRNRAYLEALAELDSARQPI